jgi:hypothetical protein
MITYSSMLARAAAVLLVAGCSSSSATTDSSAKTTSTPAATATAKTQASAKPTAKAEAPPKPETSPTTSAIAPTEKPDATASAAPTSTSGDPVIEGQGAHHAGKGVFLGVPTTRSKVPSPDEWSKAQDIKEIPGNTGDASDCEVRAVREWLRVSCRPFGGMESGTTLPRIEAEDIKLTTDGKDDNGADAFTFASNGVASVVVALLDGKRRDAIVSYGDAYPSKHITIDWPHGAPGPTVTFSR